MSTPDSPVVEFFNRFPAAHAAYQETPLYHLTHSRYVPAIQSDGLRPHPELFPKKQGDFLIEMYSCYGAKDLNGAQDPNDLQYIQRHILDSSKVYVSTKKPDMKGFLGYGIPERLSFLMRGMAALATKASLTQQERDFAQDSFDGHFSALTEGEPSIVALEIDPLAPSILNSRFGRHTLDRIDSEQLAIATARHIDGGYANNIPVSHTIQPAFIRTFGHAPVPPWALASLRTEPGWATSIH